MEFKFISLNIWKGNLIDKVVAFLDKEKPQILALQEVFNGKDKKREKKYWTYQYLQKKLDLPYSFYAPECLYKLDEGKVEHGNAIFSRFPLKDQEVRFYDIEFSQDYVDKPGNYENHPHNLQHARAEVKDKNLHLFNTHGIWGLSGRDNQRRLQMSRTIVETVKNHKHVVLAGDLNLQPDTQTIKNIEKQLDNVFKDKLISTFNMKRKSNPGYKTAVVDMIFVSPAIEVLDRCCPQEDISDHFPLVCTLKL